jgi:eukaryotic-like serine/threonine-protein kinase
VPSPSGCRQPPDGTFGYSACGSSASERCVFSLTTAEPPGPKIRRVLRRMGNVTESAATSPVEVEQAVRRQLYGDRPSFGVAPTRRRPLGRHEARPSDRPLGGRYRLLERIGAGGMATIYRARDERLSRYVAVKVIAERHARDPDFVRRFRREGQICGGLAHPNIVAILDVGVVPRDYIVMELVSGIDAGALLKRDGRPTPGEAVHLVAQVAGALAYAHDRGVVHQDVSPHNILISSADSTAKLADFGLASDSLDTARRDTGGTPGYIAPEVLAGEAPSPRSDLYSLGAVAYRLLAGAPPSGPGASHSTAPLLTTAPAPVPLAEIHPKLPRALSETVRRALADEPHARQRSVRDFRAELVAAIRSPAPRLLLAS